MTDTLYADAHTISARRESLSCDLIEALRHTQRAFFTPRKRLFRSATIPSLWHIMAQHTDIQRISQTFKIRAYFSR